jgi:hypothetical protein
MNLDTGMITRHLPSRAINNNLEMINQASPICAHVKLLAPENSAISLLCVEWPHKELVDHGHDKYFRPCAEWPSRRDRTRW